MNEVPHLVQRRHVVHIIHWQELPLGVLEVVPHPGATPPTNTNTAQVSHAGGGASAQGARGSPPRHTHALKHARPTYLHKPHS